MQSPRKGQALRWPFLAASFLCLSLALQVTYAHPKLDNPFTYKLVFKRND